MHRRSGELRSRPPHTITACGLGTDITQLFENFQAYTMNTSGSCHTQVQGRQRAAAVVAHPAMNCRGWNGSTWQTNPTGTTFFRIYNQASEQHGHCTAQKSIRYHVYIGLLQLVQICNSEEWSSETWRVSRQVKLPRQVR
jgi:hypothetical protein